MPHLPPAARWSPVPLMLVSGLYGLIISFLCVFVVPIFRQRFSDFKVDLPEITIVVINLSEAVTRYWLWVILIPVSILWPLAVVPMVPVPQQPESRRAIARTTRLLALIIWLFTGLVLVLALFAPMIALMQSVSGPQKK